MVLRPWADDPRPRLEAEPAAGAVTAVFPRAGLRIRRPAGWRSSGGARRVRLTSPDGAAVVAVTVAPRGTTAASLRRAAELAVLSGYPGARVVRRRPTRLGGRPATATAISAPARGGVADVAVMAAAGRWRTYAVTAVASRSGTGRRAGETGAVLRSVEFRRPGASNTPSNR